MANPPFHLIGIQLSNHRKSTTAKQPD
jgi:hypothetical protein